MDVKLAISLKPLYDCNDRLGEFSSLSGGDILPGQRSYGQWAGDGTEPTDWSEEEFRSALMDTATEHGWTIREVIDTRDKDLNNIAQERSVYEASLARLKERAGESN